MAAVKTNQARHVLPSRVRFEKRTAGHEFKKAQADCIK